MEQIKQNNEQTKLDVGSIIKVGMKSYLITDEPISTGNTIFNLPTQKLDKCIKAFPDGSMVVQFSSGDRAVLGTRWYRKAILTKGKK